ncbi:hypothetical protein B0H12DRAFT_1130745, partial [Mycena haematopus]
MGRRRNVWSHGTPKAGGRTRTISRRRSLASCCREGEVLECIGGPWQMNIGGPRARGSDYEGAGRNVREGPAARLVDEVDVEACGAVHARGTGASGRAGSLSSSVLRLEISNAGVAAGIGGGGGISLEPTSVTQICSGVSFASKVRWSPLSESCHSCNPRPRYDSRRPPSAPAATSHLQQHPSLRRAPVTVDRLEHWHAGESGCARGGRGCSPTPRALRM